jgi:cytochrome c-type biogenesis protein CcmH/NrfG
VKAAKAAKAAGNYDKALQLLAGASPTDPEAQWLVAWILAEKGQKELATAAFKAFIASAKPTDSRVAKAKAALERLGASAAPAAAPGGPPGMKGPGAPPAPRKGAGK